MPTGWCRVDLALVVMFICATATLAQAQARAGVGTVGTPTGPSGAAGRGRSAAESIGAKLSGEPKARVELINANVCEVDGEDCRFYIVGPDAAKPRLSYDGRKALSLTHATTMTVFMKAAGEDRRPTNEDVCTAGFRSDVVQWEDTVEITQTIAQPTAKEWSQLFKWAKDVNRRRPGNLAYRLFWCDMAGRRTLKGESWLMRIEPLTVAPERQP